MAINKADNEKLELQGVEFLRLGWEDWYTVSALHGRGTGDLLDAIVEALPEESFDELERKRREAATDELAEQIDEGILPDDDAVEEGAAASSETAYFDTDAPTPRIAIVGRPNVGKSSLLNQLLGEERAIVSDIPGTTRDAIDTTVEWQGRELRLIDTAGLRRRGKVASGPAAERYAAVRALKALGRADVCVLRARRTGRAGGAGRARGRLCRRRGRRAGGGHQQVGPRREGRQDIRGIHRPDPPGTRRSWPLRRS